MRHGGLSASAELLVIINYNKKLSWCWQTPVTHLVVSQGHQTSGWKVTRGHWECIIWYIVYGFLLVFFSNFIPKMHRFWEIRLQKCHDLENWVRGPSRSLEVSPCDRTHTPSYWRSIVR